MVVAAVFVALVAEKYAVGSLSPKCVPIAASVCGVLIVASALKQMRKEDVPAFRKFAGLVIAALVVIFTGIYVWPVLGPGATQAVAHVQGLLPQNPSEAPAKEASADAGKAQEKPKESEPAASAPAQPKPVLGVAELTARCAAWEQKAPRYARELYAPDRKDEPAWIVEARELDHEITRSFASFKVKVDNKVSISFATIAEKDKEYVDVILKNWHGYEQGEYIPPYYDFNGAVLQISPPNLNNHGITFLVSVLKTRIERLTKLKGELSVVPGFSL